MTVDIIKWHTDNGGFAGDLGQHACRLLRETVELCIAAGAQENEIILDVCAEIDKAQSRDEFGGSPEDLPQEFADISFLAEVFAHYANIDVRKARADKFQILLGREWEVDSSGVLWRPGTVNKRPGDRSHED